MNLIEVAKGLFTNELVNKASTSFGESESGITKALGALVPTVLSSVINKSSTAEGANAVAQMANEQYKTGIMDNIGSLLSGGGSGISGLLSGLFGNKTDLIGNLISNFAGVKSSTSSSLLSLVAPALLSLIGKHAAGNNLNAGSLASFLGSQKMPLKRLCLLALASAVFLAAGQAMLLLKWAALQKHFITSLWKAKAVWAGYYPFYY